MIISRFFCVIVFGVSGIFLHATAVAAPKQERHIFLLIGQSNMAGRAKIEEQDKVAIPHALLWNIGEKKWEPAIPPYNVHSPSAKNLSMQRLS